MRFFDKSVFVRDSIRHSISHINVERVLFKRGPHFCKYG